MPEILYRKVRDNNTIIRSDLKVQCSNCKEWKLFTDFHQNGPWNYASYIDAEGAECYIYRPKSVCRACIKDARQLARREAAAFQSEEGSDTEMEPMVVDGDEILCLKGRNNGGIPHWVKRAEFMAPGHKIDREPATKPGKLGRPIQICPRCNRR
jgi:hypothetical protein